VGGRRYDKIKEKLLKKERKKESWSFSFLIFNNKIF